MLMIRACRTQERRRSDISSKATTFSLTYMQAKKPWRMKIRGELPGVVARTRRFDECLVNKMWLIYDR